MKIKKDNLQQEQFSFRNSIRLKLLVSYIILLAFVILVGTLSYINASNTILRNYNVSTQQTLDMMSGHLEYGFESAKSIAIEYLVDPTINEYLDGQYEADKNMHNKYYTDKKSDVITKTSANTFISAIYFFSDPVYSLSSNKKSALEMYSAYANTEQGKDVLEDDNYYWAGHASVIDETLNINSDTYAVRLLKKFYGKDAMLAIDISTEEVLSILNKMNLGEGSYVSFITRDQKELQQSGSRDIILSGTDFYNRAIDSEDESGYEEIVKYKGNKYMFLYEKIGDTGALVGVLIPHSELANQVSSIKYVAFAVMLIASIFAVLIGGGIFINISKSIKYMIRKMKEVTKGDITTRFKISNKDEFSVLSQHMNIMLDGIMELLQNVRKVSKEVTQSSFDVTRSSEVFVDTTSIISVAMNEIEEGLTQQATDTISSVDKLEDLATQITTVDTGINEMKEIVDITNDSIQGSMSRMEILREKANETTDITKNIITSIEELNNKSNNIEQIINTIKGIADETTLLSLNASIEAARAGEAGRGFAVVAEEIKKLSAQSIIATSKVRDIVDEINNTTDNAVVNANLAEITISSQEEAVLDTMKAFDGMKLQVEQLIKKMENIFESVTTMQVKKEESLDNMENISAVTEEAVSSVTSINSKTQEQVITAQGLLKLSENMVLQVKQLEESMEQFSIASRENIV